MEPTYLDGDVLLAGYGLRPKVGHPHVLRLPDGPDGPRPLAVKRVARRDADAPDGTPTWWVERDNPRTGVDSWLVGALPDRDMVARVLAPRSPRSVRCCRTLNRLLHRVLERR